MKPKGGPAGEDTVSEHSRNHLIRLTEVFMMRGSLYIRKAGRLGHNVKNSD